MVDSYLMIQGPGFGAELCSPSIELLSIFVALAFRRGHQVINSPMLHNPITSRVYRNHRCGPGLEFKANNSLRFSGRYCCYLTRHRADFRQNVLTTDAAKTLKILKPLPNAVGRVDRMQFSTKLAHDAAGGEGIPTFRRKERTGQYQLSVFKRQSACKRRVQITDRG